MNKAKDYRMNQATFVECLQEFSSAGQVVSIWPGAYVVVEVGTIPVMLLLKTIKY